MYTRIPTDWIHPTNRWPEAVNIIGLGPSRDDYINTVLAGVELPKVDETWVVNAACNLFPYDVCFHMDDLRLCHTTSPASINYCRRVLDAGKPLITSVVYPEWEGAHSYPLQDIIRICGLPWFTTTVAYMVAYAFLIGVKRIYLYGIDYHSMMNPRTEEGKDCVSAWIFYFLAKGMEFKVAAGSTLIDNNRDRTKGYLYPTNLYGYCIPPIIKAADDESTNDDASPKNESKQSRSKSSTAGKSNTSS